MATDLSEFDRAVPIVTARCARIERVAGRGSSPPEAVAA
jgi:hypothetical protein